MLPVLSRAFGVYGRHNVRGKGQSDCAERWVSKQRYCSDTLTPRLRYSKGEITVHAHRLVAYGLDDDVRHEGARPLHRVVHRLTEAATRQA